MSSKVLRCVLSLVAVVLIASTISALASPVLIAPPPQTAPGHLKLAEASPVLIAPPPQTAPGHLKLAEASPVLIAPPPQTAPGHLV